MQIRPAVDNDFQQWLEMRHSLWPQYADQHHEEITAYFEGRSIDIEECLVVALQDGELAGFIELNIRDFAEGSRSPRVPYVEAWFVHEAYRGMGYGKALMKHAESWAVGHGFDELASDTELDNTRSISLHKRLGYIETDRLVCFIKKLTQDEDEPARGGPRTDRSLTDR